MKGKEKAACAGTQTAAEKVGGLIHMFKYIRNKRKLQVLISAALVAAILGGVFAGAPAARADEGAQLIPAWVAGYTVIAGAEREIEEIEIPAEPVLVQTFATQERVVAGFVPEAESDPEPQLRYLGAYKITGYDTCSRCCGKTDGITASGTQATVGRTCAADKSLPFGTVLYIEGIGYRTVEDRGGAITGGRIDVLCVDHTACYAVTGTYDVYIVES